jgi:hypothetical protein
MIKVDWLRLRGRIVIETDKICKTIRMAYHPLFVDQYERELEKAIENEFGFKSKVTIYPTNTLGKLKNIEYERVGDFELLDEIMVGFPHKVRTPSTLSDLYYREKDGKIENIVCDFRYFRVSIKPLEDITFSG